MPTRRKSPNSLPSRNQASPEHLFALREYDLAQGKFVYTAIDEVRDRMFPLLGKIQRVEVEHLQHTRVTVDSGEVVESAPIIQEIPFNIDLKGAIVGDPSSLMDSIATAAQQKGQAEMRSFEEYVSRITEAAGTSFDAKGKPLNRQTILESMEVREIEFDEDGYPGLPAEIRHLFHDSSQSCTCFTDGRFEQYYLHASPQRKTQIAQLPPPSREELRTYEKLMEKKRREFNDRKRHRQLPR